MAASKSMRRKRLTTPMSEEEMLAQIEGLDPVETHPDPAPPGSLTAEEERTDGQAPDGYDTDEDAAHDAAQEGFRGKKAR